MHRVHGEAEVVFTLPLGLEIGRVWSPPRTIDGRHFILSGNKSQSDVWIMENFDPEVK